MDQQTLFRPISGPSDKDTSDLPCVSSPGTSSELMMTVLQLAEAWRTQLTTDFAKCRLNDARFAVLQAIEEADPDGCSQKELARQLRNSESNISTLLDRMVTDGLVERRRSQSDRRKSLIRLTEKGAARLNQARDVYHRSAGDLLADWPLSQCRNLTDQLRQLHGVLDSAVESPCHNESTMNSLDSTRSKLASPLS
ncbi:Transcriptional regulator SlyA [Symmachiella dynata]|uniref:MarR family winged helix-turn-helix transcriptional regulator n=1 Tax=Symmachiella dynata TaxID=2527995 RepID=UPI00118A93AF|nr:MarR family transcriptional regulator [Symmachiella dynata]QDT46890.1 Transcriptional regulator SlyA [Symmachiella dynata]